MSPDKHSRPVPPPMQVRMMPIAAAGTLLWTIALVLAQMFRQELAEAGREWWVACAATGVALGVIGTAAMAVADRKHFGSKGHKG